MVNGIEIPPIKKPFISVIIICYNYGHFLRRALEACATQTYKDFEIVIVNNGSMDNTSDVIKQFCAYHSDLRISIVTIEKNCGLAPGRNAGLNKARGEYVLYNDADDWMDENCLELLANKAKESKADRIVGSFRDITDTNKVVKIHAAKPNSSKWHHNMLQANLFKRSVFVENGIMFGNVLWDDVEITAKFNAKCDTTAFVGECCYNYLVHPSTSRTNSLHETMWNNGRSFGDMVAVWRSASDKLSDNNEKIVAEYRMVHIYFYFIYFILKNAPLRTKWEEYPRLHSIMLSYFPYYQNNPNITLLKNNGVDFSARVIVWIAIYSEKMSLIKVVLLIYHLLNKFVYFKY